MQIDRHTDRRMQVDRRMYRQSPAAVQRSSKFSLAETLMITKCYERDFCVTTGHCVNFVDQRTADQIPWTLQELSFVGRWTTRLAKLPPWPSQSMRTTLTQQTSKRSGWGARYYETMRGVFSNLEKPPVRIVATGDGGWWVWDSGWRDDGVEVIRVEVIEGPCHAM